MQQKETIRVLLVDDHPFVVEGIRSCLNARQGFEVVGVAANGKQAVEMGTELTPSVIVMDVSMPVMNGLEATRYLHKCAPRVKVLILTLHDRNELASEIIESGARGYVSKNSPPTELVDAIETVHRGGTYFGATGTEGALTQYAGDLAAGKPVKAPELSLREREVLTLIADGFSNKQTADMLGVSVRTVEKHRERIMDKLKLHSVVELTKYAIAHQMVQVN